jgi:hypothetical protein
MQGGELGIGLKWIWGCLACLRGIAKTKHASAFVDSSREWMPSTKYYIQRVQNAECILAMSVLSYK